MIYNMIISLPVKIYDKYCHIPFIINITNELLSINPINNEMITICFPDNILYLLLMHY